MSKRHGAREQKRLAKQKAKREAKRRQLAKRESPDPTVRLKSADRWPVVAALVPDTLWSTGIGNLLFARRMPDGRLACGVFLLDVYCLGVKDAWWKIVSTGDFKEIRKHVEEQGRLEDAPPEYFAKLVYRAVDYAQSLGFPPHRDFRHAQRLLAGIDPSQCPDEFEFGQNGRPHYIAGPSEPRDKARAIARQVAAQGGHFTIPLGHGELPDFELVGGLEDDFELDEMEEDEFDDDFDEFEDDYEDEFEDDSDDDSEDDDSEDDEFEDVLMKDDRPDPDNAPRAKPRRRWWLPGW
jgi:hypothetical protein